MDVGPPGGRASAAPTAADSWHTPVLVGSRLIAIAGTLVLLEVALLLIGLASTRIGPVYASVTAGSAALVPLALAALHRREGSRGRHVRR